jgi:hypothetical protein
MVFSEQIVSWTSTNYYHSLTSIVLHIVMLFIIVMVCRLLRVSEYVHVYKYIVGIYKNAFAHTETLDRNIRPNEFYIFQRCTYVVYISYQHIYFNIYSIFSFMFMFFKSLFVFFLLTILLSLFLRLTNFDYPLVVFKLFSQILM